MEPKITVCNKVCYSCAFNGNSKDTLYMEAIDLITTGSLFPCHMYLKSKTGSENTGVEKLDEVKVCRGYVAFMKKYFMLIRVEPIWKELFDEIDDSELDEILDISTLVLNNKHLREGVYLGN